MVIESTIKLQKVSYMDMFVISVRYCTGSRGLGVSHLSITAEVQYSKKSNLKGMFRTKNNTTGKIDIAVFDWLSELSAVLSSEIKDTFRVSRAQSTISLKPHELPTPEKSDSDQCIEMVQPAPPLPIQRLLTDKRLWSAFLVIAFLVLLVAIKIQARARSTQEFL